MPNEPKNDDVTGVPDEDVAIDETDDDGGDIPDFEPPAEESREAGDPFERDTRPVEPEPERIRLAKLIAQRGLASRRRAEQLITEGEVTVNGVVVTELVTMVSPSDRVKVEGVKLPPEPRRAYYVIYKPRGVLVGEDTEGKGRPSLRTTLDEMNLRADPVGRLDFNSEGAVLLTNDGDLANKLTHPSSQVPKRYVVKVYRTPDAKDLERLQNGVHFPDGTRSRPCKARVIEKKDRTDKTNSWIEITITESGQKVVQRMLTQIGHPPSKVRRESFATISIRGMERGSVRELTAAEVARLKEIAGGTEPRRAGKQRRGEGFAVARPKPARTRSKKGAQRPPKSR